MASDITDVLKKNAGVDVVQYNGVLSGVGIRGFRPETSGVNKRSLLLIDGRPSGVTNLATLLVDNVDRIEIMKGPASSVYGASAMGGVINVITKHSRGKVLGSGRAAYGSFAASEVAGRAGGNLTPRLDFDVTANAFNQAGDYRMGDGVVRPFTTYKTYDGSMRLGADLSHAWRVDGRVNGYLGRDIDNPGDVFTGTSSQGRKNLERSTEDVRLSGQLGSHLISSTYFMAEEQGHTSNVRTTNPLDQAVPPLPVVREQGELERGAAARRVGVAEEQPPRRRRRPRSREQHQPVVHAHRRPAGTVLRGQQQEHDRRLRGEHHALQARAPR